MPTPRLLRPYPGSGAADAQYNFGVLLEAASRQDVAEGDLLTHRHPQPQQLSLHPPAGFVDGVHHAAASGIAQRMPGGLAPARYAVYRSANRTAVHAQAKSVLQHGAASPWGIP